MRTRTRRTFVVAGTSRHPRFARFFRWQRALDATVWPRLFGGCHTSRDLLSAMTEFGFRLERVERLPYAATSIPFPAHHNVPGVAVRPAEALQT